MYKSKSYLIVLLIPSEDRKITSVVFFYLVFKKSLKNLQISAQAFIYLWQMYFLNTFLFCLI